MTSRPALTPLRAAGQNGRVIRGLLLALVLWSATWATSARVMPVAPDTTTLGAAAEICSGHDPWNTGHPDSWWGASTRFSAHLTESLWKSSVVHAELAGAPNVDVLVAVLDVRAPHPPARVTAPHLLRIPLLI